MWMLGRRTIDTDVDVGQMYHWYRCECWVNIPLTQMWMLGGYAVHIQTVLGGCTIIEKMWMLGRSTIIAQMWMLGRYTITGQKHHG